MNHYTQQSIELATQRNYLDLLFRVYPLCPDTIRDVDKELWQRIEKGYVENDNMALVAALLDLDLFPVKDGYVPFLRKDKQAIYRNPDTVNRIGGRIREMNMTQLWERCSQPKETNRQMGPLFRNWVKRGELGMKVVGVDDYSESDDNVVLDGSDKQLHSFVQEKFNYRREKGIDFVAKRNGRFIVGEAKFISDEGGHQNDQFLDAMETLKENRGGDVTYIAILDGVLYIPSRKKMYRQITEDNLPVMSALVLRDFIYSR